MISELLCVTGLENADEVRGLLEEVEWDPEAAVRLFFSG